MRILATGLTGFVGRHLASRLRHAGTMRLLGVSRDPSTDPDGVEWLSAPGIAADDVDAWSALMTSTRPDVVCHVAAAGVHPSDRDAARLAEINTTWPATLVRAAAASGVDAVLVLGSSAEYARHDDRRPIDEAAPLERVKLYGRSKADGGMRALELGASLGVRVAVLRLFNVFGSGEAAHRLIPSIVAAARNGQAVALSEGTQVRDFVAVADACDAIVTAIDALVRGALAAGAYNVCTGTATSVADFALRVAAAIGADPALLRLGALPMRPDEFPWLVGDPRRFRQATGWQAQSDLAASIALATSDVAWPSARGPATRGRASNPPAR